MTVKMPHKKQRRFKAIALGCALVAGADAAAQGSGHGLPQDPTPVGLSQEEKWRRRFPQPVLVSDLIGRLILDRNQGVLGRLVTLVRTPDKQLQIVFSKRTLFGFGGPTVAVPTNATALLGQFIMVMDLSEEDAGKLPAWTGANAPSVDRNSRVEMALTKH